MKTLRQPITNTTTDTGVLFSIGNAVKASGTNINAVIINIAVASLAIGIRGLNELKKVGIKIPTPRFLNTLTTNPGNALTLSGIATLGAAGFTATEIPASPQDAALKTAVFTLFGLASIFRGQARKINLAPYKQQFMDAAGIVCSGAGLTLSAPESPAAIQITYAAAAGMAIYLKGKQSRGILQPDLLFAGTAFANAATSSSPELIITNCLYGLGFISFDAMRKSGGLYQASQKLTQKVRTLLNNDTRAPQPPEL